MAETGSNIKTAAITVLSTLALAMGYNYIGVDSSGRKIDNDSGDKPKTEISETEKQLKLKELEIKEKELALKMRQIELSQNKNNNVSESFTEYDLNGSWTGNNGFQYELSQNGSRVSYTETNVLLGQKYTASSGTGILKGNKINISGFGLYGQNIQLKAEIIDDNTLTLSGLDFNGNTVEITLSKN